MSEVAVITDTTASIPTELVEQYDIYLVPFNLHLGECSYREKLDITPSEAYRWIRETKNLATTSFPAVGVYIDAFKEVSSKADSILFISISEEWTPAFDIAKQARESIPYTEVELMDARTSIGAQGLIALEAARAAASGQELAQVVKRAEEIRKKVNMIATPDTLYYLAKGGRIGTASRLLGSMLSVKPIVELRDIVRGVERVRTRARAVKRLAEIMKERAGTEAPVHVIIDEADCLEEAEKLRNRISDEFNCAELYICELSPVPGAHLGPGTLGLSFYAE